MSKFTEELTDSEEWVCLFAFVFYVFTACVVYYVAINHRWGAQSGFPPWDEFTCGMLAVIWPVTLFFKFLFLVVPPLWTYLFLEPAAWIAKFF